ncbi:unnamed protein product [Closterium sp. NIES-53]
MPGGLAVAPLVPLQPLPHSPSCPGLVGEWRATPIGGPPVFHPFVLVKGGPQPASPQLLLQAPPNAWGKTFPGWARGAYCDEISGVSCDYSGMITTIDSTANFNGSIPDSISSLTSLSRL